MTIQNFYIQSGGASANSGTTNSNTPVWSNTSSVVWVGTTTGTLTVTDSAASAVQVGDWINIGGSCVMQVASINSASAPTYVITVTTTAGTFYGTEPTGQTYSTNGKVVDGGAWPDFTTPIALGSFTIPGSSTIYAKSNATLGGAAAQTIAWAGAVTKVFRIAGYVTTPGDLDMPAGFPGMVAAGTTYPAIPYTSTGRITFSGIHTEVSGFNITGSVNSTLVSSSGSTFRLHNCLVANATNNTSAGAASCSATNACLSCCDLTVAGNVAVVTGSSGNSLFVESCTINGTSTGTSQHGITAGGTGSTTIVHKTTFNGLGGNGISSASTGNLVVLGTTFKGCGVDGIHLSSVPVGIIASNYFEGSGANDINNASGANTDLLQLLNNDTYFTGSGAHLAGFGDWSELGAITESSSQFVSSTDLHIQSTSSGAGAGLPGQWVGLTPGLTSTPDVGAWQRVVTAGGGGGTPILQSAIIQGLGAI
jgi:hypothetical protein